MYHIYSNGVEIKSYSNKGTCIDTAKDMSSRSGGLIEVKDDKGRVVAKFKFGNKVK